MLQKSNKSQSKSFEEEVENVRVVIRIRPLSRDEAESGFHKVTSVNPVTGTVAVTNPQAPPQEPPKSFTFDIVFDTDSKQVGIQNSHLVRFTLTTLHNKR